MRLQIIINLEHQTSTPNVPSCQRRPGVVECCRRRRYQSTPRRLPPLSLRHSEPRPGCPEAESRRCPQAPPDPLLEQGGGASVADNYNVNVII